MTGQEEGLKDRPAVVVIAQQVVNGKARLLVAPVTHSPPTHPDAAVEMPTSSKSRLGLDADRSWIVATEMNQFFWPGPDVRISPVSAEGSPRIGAIPQWLVIKLRAAIQANVTEGRLNVTKRTE